MVTGTNQPREEDFGGDTEAFHRAYVAYSRERSEILNRLSPNTITAKFDAEMSAAGMGGFGYFTIAAGFAGDVTVIQHELLHSIGLVGGRACFEKFGVDCNTNSSSPPQFYYAHSPVAEFPESEMAYASPYDDRHGLSAIDGEVIQTIYTSPLHTLGIESQSHRERINDLEEERRRVERNLESARATSDVAAIDRWQRALGHVESGLELLRAQSVISHDMLSPENIGPWDDYVIRYSGAFHPKLSIAP